MSLVATLRSGADAAFSAVGDVAEPITIKRAATGAYDPSTGSHASDASAVGEFDTDCVPGSYEAEQVSPGALRGTGIDAGDVPVFVRVAKCAFEPETGHSATYRGKKWGIQRVVEHGQTLFELQLRRPE